MPPEPRQTPTPERDPDDQRDRDLVARAQQGEQAALSEWLERYQDRLFAVAYRMVGRREDAADVVQDVMIQLIKGLHRYDGRARVSTWAYRIAMNVSISHLRREGRRRHPSLDAPVGGEAGSGAVPGRDLLAAPDAGPDHDAIVSAESRSAAGERVQDTLDRLADDHRAVLVMRDVLGMDYQQIAEAIDVPVGTIKSRLFRARIAFRAAAEGGSPEPDRRSSPDAGASPGGPSP